MGAGDNPDEMNYGLKRLRAHQTIAVGSTMITASPTNALKVCCARPTGFRCICSISASTAEWRLATTL